MIYNIEGYLCNYGFCVKILSINPLIIDLLKKYFSVKPEQNYENEKIPDKDKYFDVYYQDDKYIVLPKFSTNLTINIGKINNKKNIKISNIEYTKITFLIKKFKYSRENINFEFKGKLRDYQELIISEIFKKFNLDSTKPINHNLSELLPKGGLIKLSCGGGKCLGINTPILMYEGTIKLVQDIQINDKLMGDDSTPRNILSLARGREQMYKVIQEQGNDYVVNSSHILSLYNLKTNKIVDISIQDYLKLENICMDLEQDSDKTILTQNLMQKYMVKGGLYGIKKVVEFEEKKIELEPYFFGQFLINDYKASDFYSDQELDKININLYQFIINIKLFDDNNINFPDEFKYNSLEIRKQLIAGIIETESSVFNEELNSIEININNQKILEELIFISQSIGLITIKNGNKIILGGNNLGALPYKLNKHKIKKTTFSFINYYNINVVPLGLEEDDYYGFEIDGNKRFLLGDFTITHNTMLAIYLSWVLGLKTLVVTHKEFLMDQWEKRIKQFSTAKIGRIRQNKIDVEGKDIVIGMLRSLSTKDYPADILHQFGLVIYDEVHHTGSRVDSQALLKTSAEYTIGLSATPERSDDMTKVINWHVGDILYEMEKKYNYRVLVKKIFFRSTDALFIEKKMYFQGRFAPSHTKMIENLTKIKTRNQLIVNFIDVLKGMGRKILILSYRVEHLELLKGMIDAKIEADKESHIYNSYYYMGKTKRTEKDMAEKDGHIIFATMQLAEEGLDIAHLDTIIFALPVSIQKDKKISGKIKSSKTLIQSIGRILRNDKLEDLTQIPLVIDLSDMFSIYSGWSNKRNEVYETKNWYMQNYYWNDLEYQFKSNQDKQTDPMNIVLDDITDEDFIEKNLMLTEEEVKKITIDDKSTTTIDDKSTTTTIDDKSTTTIDDNLNKTDNKSTNKNTNIKISKNKSSIQKNDLINIPEPIVNYGFGKLRY